MFPTSEATPVSLPEALAEFGVDFHGWYAESAEGVLVRFEDDPAEGERFADELEETVAEAA